MKFFSPSAESPWTLTPLAPKKFRQASTFSIWKTKTKLSAIQQTYQHILLSVRMWRVWAGSDVREVAIEPHTHSSQHSEFNKAFDADCNGFFRRSPSVIVHVSMFDSSTGGMSTLCQDTSTALCPQRLYCRASDSVMTPGYPLWVGPECDTETAVCHTYTHADRQTRRDVVAQSRAVIIQHLTESVVISWRLHSWAHKRTLAMWYAWLTFLH